MHQGWYQDSHQGWYLSWYLWDTSVGTKAGSTAGTRTSHPSQLACLFLIGEGTYRDDFYDFFEAGGSQTIGSRIIR